MGTILRMGFAQAQVHTNHGTSDVCTIVCAKPFFKIGPHGEVAFPTRSLVTAYSCNLFKLGKKYLCSTIGKGYFMISFTYGTAQNSCVLPCVNDTLWFHLWYSTEFVCSTMISTICGFTPNSQKKSWMVSTPDNFRETEFLWAWFLFILFFFSW